MSFHSGFIATSVPGKSGVDITYTSYSHTLVHILTSQLSLVSNYNFEIRVPNYSSYSHTMTLTDLSLDLH